MSDRSGTRKRRDRALLDRETSNEAGASERRERADVQADEGVISIDEVCDLYPGEWVLMELCPPEPGKFPSHGRVIAHDRSRDRMDEVRWGLPSPPAESGRSYYLFEAARHLRTGAEVREALKRLSEMDVDIDEAGMRRW